MHLHGFESRQTHSTLGFVDNYSPEEIDNTSLGAYLLKHAHSRSHRLEA